MNVCAAVPGWHQALCMLSNTNSICGALSLRAVCFASVFEGFRILQSLLSLYLDLIWALLVFTPYIVYANTTHTARESPDAVHTQSSHTPTAQPLPSPYTALTQPLHSPITALTQP